MKLTRILYSWIAISTFCGCLFADQPNVVLVFIDDMGWGDFSCFGNEAATTPIVDQMAVEGMRFEQFYVNSPICSPSRVAITTGQYPHRWRITSYLAHRKLNNRRGMAQWLNPKAPSLARFLQKDGYRTGHFGKWHMGGQRDVGEAPLISKYGFDASLTNFEGLGPRVVGLRNNYDGTDPKPQALGTDKLGRGEITYMDRCEVTGAFTKAAIEFIKEAQSAGKPFYVNLWPDDVHTPLHPSKERRGDGSRAALYKGVLEEMDAQLSEIFDYLRSDDKLRDNTLVLICSDNGPDMGYGSAGPFQGSKVTLFEGGIRSPLVVWGPGLLDPSAVGTVNKANYFSAMDLVPSLLNICGTSVPDNVEFDGRDVSPVLLGKSNVLKGKPIFFRRPPDRNELYDIKDLPDLAARFGQWKFLCEYDGEKPQLYDLCSDPGEARNLAKQNPEMADAFLEMVMKWNASMPQDNWKDFE